MSASNGNGSGSTWGFWPAIGIAAVCAACGAAVWLGVNVGHSLDRATGLQLTLRYKRWVEAGRPSGEKLAEFMQGRGRDIVVSNRLFIIGGTNYVTQFAATKSKSGRSGALFVSTNEVLIWLGPSGNTEIFSIGPGKQ